MGEEFFAKHTRTQAAPQQLTKIKDGPEWGQLTNISKEESRTAEAPEEYQPAHKANDWGSRSNRTYSKTANTIVEVEHQQPAEEEPQPEETTTDNTKKIIALTESEVESSDDHQELYGRVTAGGSKRESIKEAIKDKDIGVLVITGPAVTCKTYTAIGGDH